MAGVASIAPSRARKRDPDLRTADDDDGPGEPVGKPAEN